MRDVSTSLDMTKSYAEMRDTARVRERALFVWPRIPNELELQARWFAGDFGKQFVSTAGDKIEVVQFGTWNREAGPDFRDAAIRVNGSQPIRGCIEIELIDRNWEIHGHATNPAFDETVLHVFVHGSEREFFTRTRSNRNVPQVRIDPATLPDAFRADVALAKPGRCQGPLKNLPEERIRSVLDAAAQFRLQRKAATIRAKIDNHGRDETLFQEIAVALGYKENKLPFTLIAQRVSLKSFRENVKDGEAMLFGIAGFLETPDLALYKRSTRNYVRELWDCWWPHRDEMQRLILPTTVWRISSTRPANHPQRRLAALSILAREWLAFRHSLGKNNVAAVRDFLGGLAHPFWETHYTLTAKPSTQPMALVGESRIADILANIIFPFWHAEDVRHSESVMRPIDLWSEYAKLSARLSNRRLETGATRLFGQDPRRKQFLKTVAHQQGLLQIYEDFCLQDNSDCAECPFPEQMRKWV
ncbi:MAG TPA: DUF2851 family protein [Chthoniobacterales bacterium]|jgi:hypothetical protein|nr:DUF2851 family protein [Chthoniobacterales bacterium]